MAWIELHQSVWTHKKTLILAAELNLDETQAAAYIIRLWTWALDNAPEGDLTGLPAKVIAFGAGWRGEPETFVHAAINAGWIDADDRMVIHDWMDYAGRLIEKRKADADRKRQWRENNTDATRMSDGQDADAMRDGQVTVPNRTLPINNTSATPSEISFLSQVKGIVNYPFDYEKDLGYLRMLVVDFPSLDVLAEVKKWSTYKMDKPLKHKANARLQFRNWLIKSCEYNNGKKQAGYQPPPAPPESDWQYPAGYGED